MEQNKVDSPCASTGSREQSVTTVAERMDERTLEALRGSIEKWKAIESGEGADLGSDNCALCQLFADVCDTEGVSELFDYEDGCFGCPVAAKAEKIGCENTPYMGWLDSVNALPPRRANTAEQRAAARAEREFLESLLPSFEVNSK